MISPVARAAKYGEKDVWAIFTPLANQLKSVNLGQGFPNLPAPNFIKEAISSAVREDFNQYAPSKGHPKLRQVLAQHYSQIYDRELDPEKNILITQGANQGLCGIMQAYIERDDEVLLIEPYFDIFRPSIEVCGGKVITCPLRLGRKFDHGLSANEWKLDLKELGAKISPRTKAIVLNTPHNPTGKVFDRAELEGISELAREKDLLVISDEVYDSIYYGSERPRSIATIPGMWDRTLTIGSAGKTFGVTGWRVGWLIGHPELLKWVLAVHARTVFTCQTPGQEAVARGFMAAQANGFFEAQRLDYQQRRDRLVKAFEDLGFPVAIPDGGYFFIVNMERLRVKLTPQRSEEDSDPAAKEPYDYAICRWLTEQIGVTAIPPSAFFEPANQPMASKWVRICFCKDDKTISEAIERLQKLRQYIE